MSDCCYKPPLTGVEAGRDVGPLLQAAEHQLHRHQLRPGGGHRLGDQLPHLVIIINIIIIIIIIILTSASATPSARTQPGSVSTVTSSSVLVGRSGRACSRGRGWEEKCYKLPPTSH